MCSLVVLSMCSDECRDALLGLQGLVLSSIFQQMRHTCEQGEIAPDCVLINNTEWCPIETNIWLMCATPDNTAASYGAAHLLLQPNLRSVIGAAISLQHGACGRRPSQLALRKGGVSDSSHCCCCGPTETHDELTDDVHSSSICSMLTVDHARLLDTSGCCKPPTSTESFAYAGQRRGRWRQHAATLTLAANLGAGSWAGALPSA